MSNANAYQCAARWQHGEIFTSKHLSTNGDEVWSYGHPIGVTTEGGRKIAYDCHYSKTTTGHCTGLRSVAAAVVPCRSCAR